MNNMLNEIATLMHSDRKDFRACEKVGQLRRKVAAAWAYHNDWRCSKGFLLSRLSPTDNWLTTPPSPGNWYDVLDHSQFFNQFRKPVAIVAHVYLHTAVSPVPAIAYFCQRYGLIVHVAPSLHSSWYNPDATTMLVYTRPGTTVQWLPEQYEEGDPLPAWMTQRFQEVKEAFAR